ncbi:hypothetical protein AA313_de0210227 [Arthrobotrys entomopaga]|nr:hypothetical protein AA313_de0210227 [Arthrobotrys entomopaga]
MLNGNPAVDIWNGIKIGRGVGEEEKDLLGEFAVNNLKEDDGSERLVDLVVSRFGKLPGDEKDSKKSKTGFSTRGTGRIPGPDDGCIFRGMGTLRKESVRDIAEWMARWYQYGDSSFDYQTVRPSRKKLRRAKSKAPASDATEREQSGVEVPSSKTSAPANEPTGNRPSANEASTSEVSTSAAAASSTSEQETVLPPPLLLLGGEQNAQKPSIGSDSKNKNKSKGKNRSTPTTSDPNPSEQTSNSKSSDNTLMLNVLTLGTYAAYLAWNKNREAQEAAQGATQDQSSDPSSAEASGRFIIGYTGALDGDENDDSASAPTDPKAEQKDFISTTVWVARNRFQLEESTVEGQNDIDKTSNLEECRLVAYAAYPFIFAMLFRCTNESLSKPALFKSLHQQLSPLKAPLIASSEKQYQPSNNKGVFDLIFDPTTLTVHTSLPSIPEPVFNNPSDVVDGGGLPRIEALHVHTQIIRVIEDTRWREIPLGSPSGERERTNRTTRGWWIAWMRLEGIDVQTKNPIVSSTRNVQIGRQGLVSGDDDIASFIGSVSRQRRGRREAFIVRKGSDHRTHVRSKDSKTGFSIPIKLSGGLGIDTKRYFDQLLNLTART